jgi:carbamoyltransferase
LFSTNELIGRPLRQQLEAILVPGSRPRAPSCRQATGERRIAYSQGAELETLKKVWLEPTRGFLSDEFFFMAGLGALYSRVSSYIFGDWNKCGEVMGLAPYGRPERLAPPLHIDNGEQVVPEWTAAFDKLWLPDVDADWEASSRKSH